MFEGCTAECARPVPCPRCGNDLPPRGRSVPMEMNLPTCCGEAQYTAINTRHIWSVEELADA
jgi:hypothetical protein